MMDQGGGWGHRIEFGHDLDGLFHAEQLQGMQGVRGWMDHMSKDFMTPAGLPLPFAMAFVHLTPIDSHEAVDWLCVNAADFAELAVEAAAVQVIATRFAENKKAYQVALWAGLALGFVDHNPLLIAFSGAKWIVNARKNLEKTNPEWAGRVDVVVQSLMERAETASYWALGGDAAAHLLHLADVLPAAEGACHGIPIIGHVVDVGTGLAAVVDGMATLGIVFAARRAVRGLFGALRGVKQREAARLAEMTVPRMLLAELLSRGTPPEQLVGTVCQLKALHGGMGGL
jgi:hypothetical protein